MKLQTFRTIDEVQASLLERVLEGSVVAPRGKLTRELIAAGFTLEMPRSRVLHDPKRGWSLPLAIGEFAWHLDGSDDVEQVAYYAPIWRLFSEDGQRISGSCYGRRIFSRYNGHESQWQALIRLLHADPSTRRGVLNLQQDPLEAMNPGALDVSCVTSCQVFIRDGLLEMIVYMRSNDLIWGLPYDIFLFTMLQEMLALEVGVGLGRYHHVAGSLHLYERHFDLARQILSAGVASGPAMAPMTNLEQLPDFLEAEREIRFGTESRRTLASYWSDLLEALRHFRARKKTLMR